MSTQAVRMAFTQALLKLAKEDKDIFAVATDSRGSVTLGDFAKELPEQFVECGIAEQDAIGVSAGLANGGKKPFVCGPACFYSLRSAEQVKVDVAYSHTNVKIIGVSGGVSYGALGSTHHAIQDVALFRAVPGLQIFLPADGNQMAAMTKYLAASTEPAYVRMGRGPVPDIYEENASFIPGKANVLREGGDGAIIACGEMVYIALEAAALLEKEGLHVRVVDMHTLKPLDEDAVVEAAKTGAVLTVEEHHVYGGLGSAVAQVLGQKYPARLCVMGLPDENVYTGTSAQVFAHYGLTGEGIAANIKALLKR